MVKLLFVAAADLHFDEHGAWKYKGITGDAAFAMSQVVDYCLDNGPEALWLLGDLLNRPMPRQSAVKEILDQFDRLRGGGIPTRYILGDHDGRQDWPSLHPWPKHMDGLVQPAGSFLAYGLDYMPRGKLQAALRDIPQEAQVLMTHQKWEEFVSKSGQAKLTEVPLHVPYVFTGDFHDQVWGEFADGQYVWSPGSTHATSVADDKPRHVVAAYEADGVLDCEFVPLRSRPIHRLRVASGDDLARLVGHDIEEILAQAGRLAVPDHIRRPIVDVEYFTDIPHAHEQLSSLADRAFVFPRPRDRERAARREDAGLRKPALSIEEAVARLAAPGSPGRDWTLRLLHAKDRRAEWLAIVAEQKTNNGI